MARAVLQDDMLKDELMRRHDVAQRLSELWSMAGRAGLCAPGCSCGAGMLFTLGPGEIEADVMAFLHSRFEAERGSALGAVLAARSEATARGDASPFATWLRGLAEAPLAPPEFTALADSLRTILQSLHEASGTAPTASRFTYAELTEKTP